MSAEKIHPDEVRRRLPGTIGELLRSHHALLSAIGRTASIEELRQSQAAIDAARVLADAVFFFHQAEDALRH